MLRPIFAGLAAVSLLACQQKAKPAPPWTPGISYPTPLSPGQRGLLDRRGLIHSHNIHSHDACDGCPLTLPDGTCPSEGYTGPTILNAACYSQFRGDLCLAGMDFIFLTDHRGNFDSTEFDPRTPDAAHPQAKEGDNTMLWSESAGDELIIRNGAPVANRLNCPGGRKALIMAGNEGNNVMPVGLERHVEGRGDIYGVSTSPSNFPGNTEEVTNTINREREAGAVVLVAHPEGLTKEELATFPLDGFEMYNLHENALFTDYGFQNVGSLIVNLQPGGDLQLTPNNADTVFLGFVWEDPKYLSRWAYVLSQGQKRVTTMGSDCHQNAIPQILAKSLNPAWDDMRGDRYQRVMRWFSNHLLVTPNADGSYDDSNLKAALKGGRLYGAFEALGYPVGFDYHAAVGATVTEMGGDVDLAAHPVLSMKRPEVQNLDASKQAPTFTTRILLANGESWDEVAKGSGDLSFTPTKPGAYRAEVREIPFHLRDDFGPVADQYLSHDYVWIYSNPIYVH